MITAERLKELIKQGATIYTNRFKKPDKFKLYKDYFVDKNKLWCLNERLGFCDCVIKLDKLFEIKDHAEWYCKITAERTERFEPPMWEDIDKEYEFNFLYRQFVRPGIYFVRHIRFTTYLYDNPNQICIQDIDNTDFKIFKEKATKENYEKACEIVRNLFNKEEE